MLKTMELGKTKFSPGPTTQHQPEPVASADPDAPPTDPNQEAEKKLEDAGRKQGQAAREAELRAKGLPVT